MCVVAEADLIRSGIAGIGIDPVNIAWMQKEFGNAFRLVDVTPPTDYEPEQFDVIFGHSVFTHLTEAAQFAWLGELKRLLKPGARAYVTICSEKGVAITGAQGGGNTKEKIAAVIKSGIFDFGHQNVGVDVNAPGYYRLTAHTHDYITKRWSGYLDVKLIVPFFAAQQDMVVLETPAKKRKRK